MAVFCSCDKQKKINWAVTLQPQDKNPYGAYLCYHTLDKYFPGAHIETLPKQFKYDNIDDKMMNGDDSSSLLILTGIQFYLTESELNKLIAFAKKGNEVMIFSNIIDSKIENRFGFENFPVASVLNPISAINPGKVNENILCLNAPDSTLYGYNGRTIQGYFSFQNHIDTNKQGSNLKYDKLSDNTYSDTEKYVSDTIGIVNSKNTNNLFQQADIPKVAPNLIRYKVGEGHISFHAAPLVLSNYFLLQGNNINYLDGIWQSVPNNINRIYWNSYEKRYLEYHSILYMLQFPAIRWAFWLAVLGLLFYVIFEGKRRQRIVPIINPVENSSVSFVETIGRLYYNKGNQQNLAEKMVLHFLEWVRNTYNLNTNELNEQFILQLSKRSGQPENMVRNLLEMIHEVRLGSVIIDDAYLYQLYNNIQQFYKNHK